MSTIISIDHENNNLAEYTSTVEDLGDLSIATPGLGGSNYCLSCFLDDTTVIYGLKNLGANNTSGKARARFYIDPNTLTMATTNSFYVFALQNSLSSTITCVELQYTTGVGYEIKAGIRLDDNTYVYTNAYPISDMPHYVEIYLQRASAVDIFDGSLQLWIDGTSKETLSGKDNYDKFVNLRIAELGAIFSIEAGTTGTFFLDQLVVNDDGSEIGAYSNAGYKSHVGSFNIDTTKTAGQTQAITGLGFKPKIVLFWWGGGHSTGEEVAGGDICWGFGAAKTSSNRFNCTAWSRDNLDTSDTGYGEYVQYVISIYKDGAVDGHFDFSSMDVDGFTLVVDDQFTVDYRINYLALGGDDLIDVYIGNYVMPAAEGNFDITDIGFQPDCLLTAFTMSETTDVAGAIARLSLGMATSSSNQGEVAVYSLDNAATSSTDAYGYNGEIAGYAPVSDMYERTSFVSFLANGVRLHMADDFIGSYYIHYIALRGGQYAVSDLTTRTDGNDIVETVGFQPSAILFESVNRALSTQDVPSANCALSIGAATSTSNRAVQAIWDESGLGTTETAFANYDSAVYANVADDAIVGLMDLKSIDSSGFTCVMDDTDPSECWVTYLAFGPVGGITKSLTDTGISIDIISNLLASLSVYDTATIIEGISITAVGGLISGTTCWGHVTGVLETNIRTFSGNWTGTGSIEGSGDSENLVLDTGQYMVSEVVETGIQNVELLQNNYASGDTVTLQYRHGATQVACEAADWNDYTVPFISLGYVQVRIEV